MGDLHDQLPHDSSQLQLIAFGLELHKCGVIVSSIEDL